jgi:S-adenosyl methyltransferase
VRDPDVIMRDAARTLDFTRPVAVLLVAILHFLPDAADPPGIVAALAGGLAPGSFVVISHLTADFAPDAVAGGVAAYNALVPAGITARSHVQVTALFGGLPLAPGAVPVDEWRPDLQGRFAQPADVYAGLAAKGRRPW